MRGETELRGQGEGWFCASQEKGSTIMTWHNFECGVGEAGEIRVCVSMRLPPISFNVWLPM
jgi:hypothetical protein